MDSLLCPRILNRDRTSATVKDVHYKWRKEADQGDPVLMEGEAIARVHEFKYLGYLFVADNDQLVNLDRRIGQADSVFRSLQHIWRTHSDKLPISLKRRIYCASVVSVLTYGHETWNLDATVIRKINNFNARPVQLYGSTYSTDVCILVQHNILRILTAEIVKHLLRPPKLQGGVLKK
jgi:hypothetical protein